MDDVDLLEIPLPLGTTPSGEYTPKMRSDCVVIDALKVINF